ncbi:MAG: hypothetical protein KGS72_21075 [Cyanobacteria bacterium REEB67]|nr:hypothetical protein [Cyanobacteria bacterium REEB67]
MPKKFVYLAPLTALGLVSVFALIFAASCEAKSRATAAPHKGAAVLLKASAPAVPKPLEPVKIGKGDSLRDRIYIVPPLFGHPPVDPSTVELIKSIVRHLPRNVYNILDKRGAKIYITPNMIDHWPDAVTFQNHAIGRYFSEETGRTYGRDVYICERTSSAPGSTNLGPIMSDPTLKSVAYPLLSHALNDCLGLPSKDLRFVNIYKEEASHLNRSMDESLKVYLDDHEGLIDTFAALCGSIMGNQTAATDEACRYFPRCREWIEQRITILSER